MHWRRKWQPTPVFLPGETEEPNGLPPMGSHRVGHDGSDLAAAASYFQTPVQFQGWEDSLEEEMATHSSIHAWEELMLLNCDVGKDS